MQDLQLNRVTIPSSPSPPEPGASSQQNKTYDLQSNDRFWNTHRGSPFPEVADAVQSELAEYKLKEDEMMRLKNVVGVSEEDDPSTVSGALSDNTATLTSAIR